MIHISDYRAEVRTNTALQSPENPPRLDTLDPAANMRGRSRWYEFCILKLCGRKNDGVWMCGKSNKTQSWLVQINKHWTITFGQGLIYCLGIDGIDLVLTLF